MTKRIQLTGPTVARITDTTPVKGRRVDPDELARALGAEPCAEKVPVPLAAISLYAVRAELYRRLQSQGGRPGLEGNNVRPKIPLSDQEWRKLEELASQIASSTGLSPSPGQVGSVLLSLALRSVTSDPAEGGPTTTALVDELAARDTP